MPPSAPSLRALASADAVRGACAATCGLVTVALLEPLFAIVAAPGPVRAPTFARFLALDVTLTGLLWLPIAPLVAGFFALARVLVATVRPDAALTGAGLGATQKTPPAQVGAVPWVWGVLLGTLAYTGTSYRLTLGFFLRFKDARLIAASLATLQVAVFFACAAAAFLLGLIVRRGARALAPWLGAFNPLARALPMLALLAAAAVPGHHLALRKMPELLGVAPWRDLLATLVFVGGAAGGLRLVVRGARELPAVRASALIGVASAYLSLAVPTLTTWGADPEAKYLALSASPPLRHLVSLLGVLDDIDGDGYGSLLGENDCAPFDPKVHPGARDVPDNGIDENCNGRDFSIAKVAESDGAEELRLPPEYRRDWNVLLVTIDAVRHDHTTFGGSKARRGRDTTPRLATLSEKSVDFLDANAAAPGTMASIPAIVVSRFFHSGIHLGPERPPMPPKVLEDNTTIAEVMKRGGYRTGAILSHEYFNDWGLDQGFDTYDNQLGEKPDPYGTKARAVTDKAVAWIAEQHDRRWFLWTHYIDPHGRYVAHPGEVQYGPSEEDLYDGEIHYTDQHVGRLLDYVARLPGADRTIVVVTADHGDAFMEHGFINHGTRLYRELEHVPLLVYVPGAEPHTVDGPVSGLDVLPTLAALTGIDISDLAIDGKSLLPQLFHGRDARSRVVFAETNYPDPLRAAISTDYKLIYNLKANLYELYARSTDPGETANVWGKDAAGSAFMKARLDDWLDRVYFSRDPRSQAQQVRAQVLLASRPTPAHVTDVSGGGAVHVIGYDLDEASYAPGDVVHVTLYFECIGATEQSYRLEASLVPAATGVDGEPRGVRLEKSPLDGTFGTSRWKPGEFVKETYALTIPASWGEGSLQIAFRLLDDHRKPVLLARKAGASTAEQALLGTVPLN